MDIQSVPPSIEELAKALRPILTKGLPVSPDLDDPRLLGLRGVVARAIYPDDRLSRIKALDDLLERLIVFYPDDELGSAVPVLFGMAPGSRGTLITNRREKVHAISSLSSEHIRKSIEPKVLQQIAWQLHQDSQNYAPRERSAPPPLEISGDTPMISVGDVADLDRNRHQEMLSRLWALVYELRADVLLVERLKVWPLDSSEPETSARVLEEAIAARDSGVHRVSEMIERYVSAYGERIEHGDGEFSARALLRLAGWRESD